MKKNLLNTTLRANIIFSFLLLALFAPLFFFSIDALNQNSIDEILQIRKKEFLFYTLPTLKINEINQWNRAKTYAKIIKPTQINQRESICTRAYFDALIGKTIPCRFLSTPFTIEGQPYIFEQRINIIEKAGLIQRIGMLFGLIVLLLLVGLYYINMKLTIRLWKPFHRALNFIKQFEIDKTLQNDLIETEIEEFDQLNHAIVNLSRKNTEIFNSQLNFVENAAFELQKPLSIFQSEIDILAKQGPINEAQNQTLKKINAATEYLSRLSKNLIVLSNLETDIYTSKAPIPLNDLIEKQLQQYSFLIKEKNITISHDISTPVVVKSNPELATTLIKQLLLNAIDHNVQEGNITIDLLKESLTISSSGVAKPLAQNKLFRPFSKVNPQSDGNGLGLVISKKICEANVWGISYKHQNRHHIFKVDFFTVKTN
jgi:signal transduction histidine kinase